MAQKTTLKEFESVFPKLEEALLEHAQSFKLPEKELAWYKAVSRHACSCCAVPYHRLSSDRCISTTTVSRDEHTGRKM